MVQRTEGTGLSMRDAAARMGARPHTVTTGSEPRVPLDLRALKQSEGKPLIEPRDIFAGLGGRPWTRLRVEQDQVLKAWFSRRTERDLVIKQNTGGGKTVVGLLAAQSSLNERVGPAAYLVPDTYLVKQVIDEAHQLGLAVTDDPHSNQFRSGTAILVCTFEKVVNGRSTFGLAGDPYVTRIGTVVVDDAHAALIAGRKQFTLSIPPGHPAYDKAVSVFGPELKRQSPRHGGALVEGDRCAPLRIPFWSWAEKYERVTTLIAASAEDDTAKGVFFSWPLLADHLRLAVAAISDRGLQLRTPCPPIEQIPAFHLATRRIYLTATLADDGILVTELGADAGSVRTPITPERASDLGDRLILAPAALNPRVIDDTVRALARQFSRGDRDGDGHPEADPVNVVVLVPSDRAADAWDDHADHVLHVQDMKPVVDKMVDGEHVGVVVLVNKYDGVDLPGDACRLLVVDGVPTPLDPGEQREAGALAGSQSMRTRKVQRIEQGMGRGIRDAEDYCAVLLLGKQLALSLVAQADLDHFSPATRAQIGFSQRLAGMIEGEGLDAVREALNLFLNRDEDLKDASSQATAGVAYDPDGHVTAVAEARRQAWEQAAAADPGRAATTLRNALDGLEDLEKGWRLEEVATYQHEVDPTGAQGAIKAAKRLNTNVLMPVQAVSARPVRGHQQQAQATVDFLTVSYENGTALQLGVDQLLDDLAFRPGDDNVEAAEAALKLLGLHLGIRATRPEKELSAGPDGCWGLGPERNAVIELKTGTTRADTAIIKSETDQLSGAVSWNTDVGGPLQCVPVMIASDATLHPKASPPAGTRIITLETLESLKTHVRAFAADLAVHSKWHRPDAVAQALRDHQLVADKIIEHHSVKPQRPRA
ncbi:DEAD/DEAH box helicase [Janibacter melonis]|uniref:DEAD/DEAH box helicase n=1 Tax=Janibacter melonis TaxID=262209 RepID=UPI0020436D4D|nr:DEAD/DEAH box helicase [Janibacter melonis]MCM3556356.1 DEAD/DEAH box helicase [Janibacter melonis]